MKPTDADVLAACRRYVEAMWEVKKAWDAMPKKRYDAFDPRRYKPENRLFAAESDLEGARGQLKKVLIDWHVPKELSQKRKKARQR